MAVATAATFVWLGMVLAISFLEAPLKFRAPGVTTVDAERMRQLEQENRELKRANEILKRAASFFGAELDRQHRR